MGRVFVPKALKLKLTVQILLRSILDAGFHQYKVQHQVLLHQALKNLPYANESTL